MSKVQKKKGSPVTKTIVVSPQIWTRTRVIAAQTGETISWVVETALWEYSMRYGEKDESR